MSYIGTPYRGRHAIDRAAERYGLQLTPDQIRQLEVRCERGGGVLVARLPNGCEKRALACEGRDIVVIWNPAHGRIVTIVPKRWEGEPLRPKCQHIKGRAR